jgi:hypothetical protein
MKGCLWDRGRLAALRNSGVVATVKTRATETIAVPPLTSFPTVDTIA